MGIDIHIQAARNTAVEKTPTSQNRIFAMILSEYHNVSIRKSFMYIQENFDYRWTVIIENTTSFKET